jgi:hypothetical protein
MITEQYGPFMKDEVYVVYNEGIDLVQLKKRGTMFYVPKSNVTFRIHKKRYKREDMLTYEEIQDLTFLTPEEEERE